MKPARTALALLLALSVPSWSRIAIADPPPEEFEISFDGDAAIWNPFEGFEACETVTEASISVTLCLTLDNVVCDGAGQCTGMANFEFNGALSGSGSGVFFGKTRCVATPDPNDPICRARLEIEDLVSFNESCEFDLDLVMKGPVDHAGLYRGTSSVRVCVTCPGADRQCSVATARFEYPVDPPTPWTLVVQSQPSMGNPLRLKGEAFDSLGFTYRVRGEQSVGNGVSSFVLRGDPETESKGAGIELRNLVFHGEDLQAGTALIRVQGNKVRHKLGD